LNYTRMHFLSYLRFLKKSSLLCRQLRVEKCRIMDKIGGKIPWEVSVC